MDPTHLRRFAVILFVLTLLGHPSSGRAQAARTIPAAATARSLVRAGDAAHTALRPLDALDSFSRALEAEPEDYEALWRSARETVTLGMLAANKGDRKRWYAEAEDYARRARLANPVGPRGAEWLAIALGRKALEEGPRSRVRLAGEIRETAMGALALDSLNAGAHHVLGEWNAEIRRLSGVERWVARTLLGASVFADASWEDAEYHLRRSIELDAGGLVHYLDLARLYLDRERADEACDLLREVLARPAVEPMDPLIKQMAQELLRVHRGPDPKGPVGLS